MSNYILEVKNLSKYYAGVKALENISMQFRPGEIHAIAGENGAGKSTLIKTLTGAIEPTGGTIVYEGKDYSSFTPTQAIAQGISAVYQEFNLIPYLSVAENVFFGKELMKGAFIDKAEMNRVVKQTLNEMEIDLNPNALVSSLGVAYQQIIEIVKAVLADSKVLIMDEPTAPLTNNEIEVLFKIIERLREKKVTIIYISHRMEEIFRICDRVTVMRDGKYITTQDTNKVTRKELIAFMVGRELGEDYPKREQSLKEVVLEVDGLTNANIGNVCFNLHKGEILGFGGLVGAGRTETMLAIYGADPISGGNIKINGKSVRLKTPHEALAKGIGLIPEDRKNQGVHLGLSVKENISFCSMEKVMVGPFINSKKDSELSDYYKQQFNIKTPSINQLVGRLSGGNQQKVVLAKILATQCDIIIFDEPTRGIDVGAKQEIYNLMRHLVDAEGKSIIMISSDMPELIGMSDRILVMREGNVVGELEKEEFTQELILEYASGLVGGKKNG